MTCDLFDGKEAARRLDITTDQLSALVRDGEISYVNIGRGKKRPRRRYTEEDLAEFRERRRRREVCLPTGTNGRHTTNSTSTSRVIGFTARRNARLGKMPKGSKPES
jgi:hypothetical protein